MQCFLISLLAVTASASGVVAQEATFLEPVDATIALGDRVDLSMVVGDTAQPWPTDRIEHFFARTAWTQENRDTVAAAADAGSVMTWLADRPGVLMVGCDTELRAETVSAQSFAAFIERVLPEPRRAGVTAITAQGVVTIHRLESVKSLIRVEAAGTSPASIATSKTGQAVEIRPLMDPTTVAIGSDLAVKVYSGIPGSVGGVVLATHTDTGETVRVTTNESATANITMTHAGDWRLEFHAVSPIDDGDASWLVHTATLTFEVAPATGGEVSE